MPKSLLAAFGMEKISVTNLMGYYATKQYPTITLFGSIYAVILASGMLSKEENDKTIEFLLSKPVERAEIVTAKLCSIVTLITVFNLLITIIMFISLQAVKTADYSLKVFLLLSVGALLLAIYAAAVILTYVIYSRKDFA